MPNLPSTDSRTHEAARRIAYRLADLISSILRDEERLEFEREAYVVAVEELAALKGAGDANS